MSSFRQQLFAFTGISGIYFGVLALAFPGQLTPQNSLAIGIIWTIFVLSALITSVKASDDPQKNVQRFLIGTTVQMLAAMSFVLAARFAAPDYFKMMSIHFLSLFFCFLAVQAVLLVKRVKTT